MFPDVTPCLQWFPAARMPPAVASSHQNLDSPLRNLSGKAGMNKDECGELGSPASAGQIHPQGQRSEERGLEGESVVDQQQLLFFSVLRGSQKEKTPAAMNSAITSCEHPGPLDSGLHSRTFSMRSPHYPQGSPGCTTVQTPPSLCGLTRAQDPAYRLELLIVLLVALPPSGHTKDIQTVDGVLSSHEGGQGREKGGQPRSPSSSPLAYGVLDIPPWYLCIFLGVQHFLTALGGLVAVPLILAKDLCLQHDPLTQSYLISTMFFVSGICTLLQVFLGVRNVPVTSCFANDWIDSKKEHQNDDTGEDGFQQLRLQMHLSSAVDLFPAGPQAPPTAHVPTPDLFGGLIPSRLPILQGGTFAFVAPSVAMLSLPTWKCPTWTLNASLVNTSSPEFTEEWQKRIRELQGAIMVASCVQMLVGFSGLIGFLMRFIGPLTVAPTIALVALPLFDTAGSDAGIHWGIAATTVFLIVLFSQYLKSIAVPVPVYGREKKCHTSKFYLFQVFPVRSTPTLCHS
ncbi:Solute carrier family 23 member 2 [Camelus dromedarius]|uniref:Solute carrier family 23 member 2 n=1 Tax=Camelus dromedarius TaxID=9838 RepID=A0A5N4DYE8_CAMDR|nr:Solute carrier family 23 member 2 [Camelus dromedarius]KAB1276119.1 Solute carrier family 23 member 2 [Camelus dromedarius]